MELGDSLVHPIINLKDSYFEPAVRPHQNFSRMCGIGDIISHLKKLTHPTPQGGLGGYLFSVRPLVRAWFRSLTSLHPLDGGVFKRTCIIHGSAIISISATSRHCSNVNYPRLCDRIIEIKLQVPTGDMKGIRHTSQTVKRCGHTQ